MKGKAFFYLAFIGFQLVLSATSARAQHTVARVWNEVLLECIRNDFARPTVHARNLYHTSTLMYDAYAAYHPAMETHFLGKTKGGYHFSFQGVPMVGSPKDATETAINYGCYKLLKHRFKNSPGEAESFRLIDSVFYAFGGDSTLNFQHYRQGNPAYFGNYLAQQIIYFGFQDGANEQNQYGNRHYQPVNTTILPDVPGNPTIVDPNRYQELTLNTYIDQSGNLLPFNTIPFLSPEWGDVVPFAMDSSHRVTRTRNGNTYHVYEDPGHPPYIDTTNHEVSKNYKWGFTMVSKWQSHLDPKDSVIWDISPASMGNIQQYPSQFDSFPNFYKEHLGGDIGTGHPINPHTNLPYVPQLVPRADYARILAEFWADGPDSETPPGHWFTILNYVNDHAALQKKWKGNGTEKEDLLWDILGYFTLGGAMHDAAIAAWSVKGYYDYLRPISAIRFMADRGQCSDSTLPNYHPAGIELDSGLVEVVYPGDSLAGANNEHAWKIKLYTWRGPDYINDPDTSMAGVGWILAEHWWPYQRPTFVTPPFAGYVSGHSTYSRAAAEVLTYITGDAYFPGGMGEFVAKKNEFLVFEEGPSTDVVLQWATYRDASDQCSLSRIWGGIHPPADDIPGRLMGIDIGQRAAAFADTLIADHIPQLTEIRCNKEVWNKNEADSLYDIAYTLLFSEKMDTTQLPIIELINRKTGSSQLPKTSHWLNETELELRFEHPWVQQPQSTANFGLRVSQALSLLGVQQHAFSGDRQLVLDFTSPFVTEVAVSDSILTLADVGDTFEVKFHFSEGIKHGFEGKVTIDTQFVSLIDLDKCFWEFDSLLNCSWVLIDSGIEARPSLGLNGLQDKARNSFTDTLLTPLLLDTKRPNLRAITSSADSLNFAAVFGKQVVFQLHFDEAMRQSTNLISAQINSLNAYSYPAFSNKNWLNDSTLQLTLNNFPTNINGDSLRIRLSGASDKNGNEILFALSSSQRVDTKRPEITEVRSNTVALTPSEEVQDLRLAIFYDEPMNDARWPEIRTKSALFSDFVKMDSAQSVWLSDNCFVAALEVQPEALNHSGYIDFRVFNATDEFLNEQLSFETQNLIALPLSSSTHTLYAQDELFALNATLLHIGDPILLEFTNNNHKQIKLLNVSGKELKTVTSREQNLRLETSTLSAGVYYLFVVSEGQSQRAQSKTLIVIE